MGIVIDLARRRHERASAVSRAAINVRVSALISDARPVSRIADHHSAGMLSRCHHLEMAEDRAPMSEAIASREGQSSITERKESICFIPDVLGHYVLKHKANLSLDAELSLGHTVRMAEHDEESQFKQEFIARVKAARASLGWKQWQMAEALGMPQDKYKQYEVRSYLPHHLIGRFCLVTRVDPEWLMTGHGEKPIQPVKLVEQELGEPAKPRRTKAKKVA